MAAAVATLFASCSKDATEDLAIANAEGAFVASMAFDADDTRHYINSNNVYEWEAGDMVGVTTAAADETIPFVTKAGGVSAVFNAVGNDLDYLGEGPYFMAYPYGNTLSATVDSDNDATTTGVLSGLTIPATQRYRANSFASMTAPAFAVVEEFAKEGQKVDFWAAASMLRFQIKGIENVETLTLSAVKNEQPMALAGDITAQVVAVKENNVTVGYKVVTTLVDDDETDPSYEVKVTFGQTPMPLHHNTTVPVVFVVKSGLDFEGATLTLTAQLRGAGTDTETITIPTIKTGANLTAAEKAQNEQVKKMKDIPANKLIDFTAAKKFGLDPYYMIGGENATLDFITYAYFAQDQSDLTSPSIEDYEILAESMGYKNVTVDGNYAGDGTPEGDDLWGDNGAAKKKALLLNDIDLFDETEAKAAFDKYSTIINKTNQDKLYIKVLEWYINNGCAIEPLAWNAVVGANDEPSVINGLTVYGNGIVTNAASLKNVKITNSTVAIPVELDKNGKVVLPANADDWANVGFVVGSTENYTGTIEKVVLGAGNVLNAAAAPEGAFVGGIAGYVAKVDGKIAVPGVKVEALPVIESGSTFGLRPSVALTKVGQIFGKVDVVDAVKVSLDDYKVTSLDVPAIYQIAGKGNVVDFTAAASVEATPLNVVAFNGETEIVVEQNGTELDEDDEDVATTNEVEKATGDDKASIVINKVSYWNGDLVAAVGGSKDNNYYTAEELAHALRQSAAAEIKLTHNIDMQDGAVEVNVNAARTTTFKNTSAYTISNIKISPRSTQSGGYVSLFGYEADLKNVNVKNLTVNLPKNYTATAVAGLAIKAKATAKNVSVENVTININATATISNLSVGGVFSVANTGDIDNVTVLDCNIKNSSNATTKAMKLRAGIIAGTLNVVSSSNTTMKKFYCGEKNHDFVNIAAAEQKDAQNKDTKSWYDVYYSSKDYSAKALPFGTVNVTGTDITGAGNVKAKLTLAETNFGSMSRLAGGIVFDLDWSVLKAKAAVGHDASAIDTYKYAFESNVNIGNHGMVYGFIK